MSAKHPIIPDPEQAEALWRFLGNHARLFEALRTLGLASRPYADLDACRAWFSAWNRNLDLWEFEADD